MEWITRWRKRLRVLLRREEVERELEEEFAFHLEMEARNNIRAGMAPEAARRRAVLSKLRNGDYISLRVYSLSDPQHAPRIVNIQLGR